MNQVIAGICRTHGFYKGGMCEQCSTEKKGEGTQVMFFTPYTYEDLGTEPVHITSKRQLKEICKERGLIAERLL